MSASGGTGVVVATMVMSSVVAVAKFIAFLVSGSSAMLAETMHSVANISNQIVLAFSGKQAQKIADAEHPLGHNREHYSYAFIISTILYTGCGVFLLSAGINKLNYPASLSLENLRVTIAVLLIAVILEFASLRAVIVSTKLIHGKQNWAILMRRPATPALPVRLLTSLAALLSLVIAACGVVLTLFTGNTVWDAAATIIIGILLFVVSIILAIATENLLTDTERVPAAQHDLIRDTINAHPDVRSLIEMTAVHVGPEKLLISARIDFGSEARLADVATSIDSVQREIREAEPLAHLIYIEPDVYRRPPEADPPTDTIVIVGND